MLDLDVVGRQLIDKASRERNAAVKYEVLGEYLHIIIRTKGGKTDRVHYHALPTSLMSNNGYQNHIGTYLWEKMKAILDKDSKLIIKSNKTILLCLITLDY